MSQLSTLLKYFTKVFLRSLRKNNIIRFTFLNHEYRLNLIVLDFSLINGVCIRTLLIDYFFSFLLSNFLVLVRLIEVRLKTERYLITQSNG
jgi:hypothetical protein